MSWLGSFIRGVFLLIIVLLAVMCSACQADRIDSNPSNQLVLDIFVDKEGRALINGYVGDIEGLTFLHSSEYSFENNSRQLYAITSALTFKSSDNWSLDFESKKGYDEFHTVFYLPKDTILRQIICSAGLVHQVYVSNGTFVVDIQGYDVVNPITRIEYRFPLKEAAEPDVDANFSYQIAALLVFAVLGSAFITFILFRLKPLLLRFAEPPASVGRIKSRAISDSDQPVSSTETDNPIIEDGANISEAQEVLKHGESIEISDKLAAVMDTLTDREQSVLRALLERGGKMTQAEIKYETDISKSSLSGILTSIEKRKIITKKKFGKTNDIEISERFLPKKERL